MILWFDGGHGPRENMRRDAALLESVVAQRRLEPVLRLFAFTPRGITLGRSQDPARELDLAALAAAGIEWAVRPTGGRAILHDEEWTFSLATALRADHWAADANRAYARTCVLLARAMTAARYPSWRRTPMGYLSSWVIGRYMGPFLLSLGGERKHTVVASHLVLSVICCT